MSAPPASLQACPCCGLVQGLPAVAARARLRCARCRSRLRGPDARRRSLHRTAAFALSALLLYPVAVTLPIVRVEQLGRSHEASVWSASIDLLAEGHLLVGLVVLLCSLVLPLLKLLGLFVLTGRGLHPLLRAWTWVLVERTGRWGMLDVLLVAMLVAVLKLGSMLEFAPGPGVIAFASCVLLNLAASTSFEPHALWEEEA